jgi:TPP-dependent pyruvate/acetoin dehydrogenase alpha subunit
MKHFIVAVWELPVLFVIENNGYGLSTSTNEQYRCENLADKGKGYGMESYIVDGNNISDEVARKRLKDTDNFSCQWYMVP